MPLAMEPAPDVASYADVPWYRKTWFVVLMIFLFWPVAIVLALTGPTYQKANAKMAAESPAAVWQSTGAGRVIMALCGIVLGALALPQWMAVIDEVRSSSQTVSATDRAEDAAAEGAPGNGAEDTAAEPLLGTDQDPDEATTDADAQSGDERLERETATPAETSTTSTSALAAAFPSTPTDVHLVKQRETARAAADEFLGTGDLSSALIRLIGDDRYGDLPQLDDARLRIVSVKEEIDDEGEIRHVIAMYYRTDVEPAVALETLRQEFGALGYVEDSVEVEEDDDGEVTTSVDYDSLETTTLDYEGLSLDVIVDGPETTVRVFRYLVGGDPVTATSLVGGVAGSFPSIGGAEVESSEVSLHNYGSGNEADLRHVVRTDTPELEAFDATVALMTPDWEQDSSTNGIHFRVDDLTVYISSSERTSGTRISYSLY